MASSRRLTREAPKLQPASPGGQNRCIQPRTNATIYNLYENGELIDTQELAVKTPQAQSAAANIQGRKPGTCEYWVELVNDSGKVSSKTITVEVKDR